MRPSKQSVFFLAGVAAALLARCAPVLSGSASGPSEIVIAEQWHAPLPHGGQLADLNQWWDQFDDPLMLRLIEAAQHVSPTVAQASARIAEARAARTSAKAALLPTLNATAETSRARQALGEGGAVSEVTQSAAGLQAGWELDLFGGARAGANAAQARLESSQAQWHDARVSVAAEVASSYVDVRACEAQVRHAAIDVVSRAQTARLTILAANAGFAPASVDQANAIAAQGTVLLIQQRAQCDLLIKALTALTAQDEAALRRELAANAGMLPRPRELRVTAMPAEVLAQRPDIYAAERDVIAANADATQAHAERWPRIALTGNIGLTRIDFGGGTTRGSVWSIGPLIVTLPLFDGGTRRANAEAARARYDAAVIVYAARLREAVREVESALVTLDSTARGSEAAHIVTRGFERSYDAVEASFRAGTTSLFEVEDARRNVMAARSTMIELERERVAAWIALYRALGGGWSMSPSPP